jgi:hypothetical protein
VVLEQLIDWSKKQLVVALDLRTGKGIAYNPRFNDGPEKDSRVVDEVAAFYASKAGRRASRITVKTEMGPGEIANVFQRDYRTTPPPSRMWIGGRFSPFKVTRGQALLKDLRQHPQRFVKSEEKAEFSV